MRKSLKVLALTCAVVFAFTACGKKEDTPATPTPTPTVEATPTVEPTEEPTVTPDDQLPIAPEGEGSEGEGSGEQGQALTSNETLDSIHDKIKEIYGENYIPSMPYDSVSLKEVYGVDSTLYDAAIAEGPMMSVHVDSFIGIHATEGNVESVQNALTAYREKLVSDSMQYPMNLPRIQGSIIETVGDYVFFVMVGTIDDAAYDNEADMAKAYEEQNKLAIEAAKEIINQ